MSFSTRLLALFALFTGPLVASASASELLARGRHLVVDIGLCADCHTPRLPDGRLDESRSLQGSVLGFKPLADMPWMPVAPSIAGLPGYTDEQAVAFLTTGVKPGGSQPLPPMPAYRFTKDEAVAVLAYLRSLKAAE